MGERLLLACRYSDVDVRFGLFRLTGAVVFGGGDGGSDGGGGGGGGS